MQYMISIKSINAISVAKCFIKYIFKLYRLPNLIISTIEASLFRTSSKPYINN